MKDKLQLSHRAMVGWAKLRLIQQKTSVSNDLALGYAYFLSTKGRFHMICAVHPAFDGYLRQKVLRNVTKGPISKSHHGATLILN